MTFYWRIVATDEYYSLVSSLPLDIQDQIQNRWIETAKHENPRDVGSTMTCSKHSEYVVVIFPGLTYEFLYKMDESERVIRLLSCERLTFLDHGQIDYP
ncbi:MAG: hypothetical protein M3P08_11445 [Thermoproteota archaeon]|nr:hypothetical protein [Thermoproteota archaeon]